MDPTWSNHIQPPALEQGLRGMAGRAPQDQEGLPGGTGKWRAEEREFTRNEGEKYGNIWRNMGKIWKKMLVTIVTFQLPFFLAESLWRWWMGQLVSTYFFFCGGISLKMCHGHREDRWTWEIMSNKQNGSAIDMRDLLLVGCWMTIRASWQQSTYCTRSNSFRCKIHHSNRSKALVPERITWISRRLCCHMLPQKIAASYLVCQGIACEVPTNINIHQRFVQGFQGEAWILPPNMPMWPILTASQLLGKPKLNHNHS